MLCLFGGSRPFKYPKCGVIPFVDGGDPSRSLFLGGVARSNNQRLTLYFYHRGVDPVC